MASGAVETWQAENIWNDLQEATQKWTQTLMDKGLCDGTEHDAINWPEKGTQNYYYYYYFFFLFFLEPLVLIILRVKNIKLETDWNGYS